MYQLSIRALFVLGVVCNRSSPRTWSGSDGVQFEPRAPYSRTTASGFGLRHRSLRQGRTVGLVWTHLTNPESGCWDGGRHSIRSRTRRHRSGRLILPLWGRVIEVGSRVTATLAFPRESELEQEVRRLRPLAPTSLRSFDVQKGACSQRISNVGQR